MDIKERRMVLHYLRNLMSSNFDPDCYDEFFNLVGRHSEELFGFDIRVAVGRMQKVLSDEQKISFLQDLLQGKLAVQEAKLDKDFWKHVCQCFDAHKSDLGVDISQPDFDRSFACLCNAFDLPQPARSLLQCLVCISKIRLLSRIVECCGGTIRRDAMNFDNADILAGMCKLSQDDVNKCLAQNSSLFDTGIFVMRYGDNEFSPMFNKLLGMRFSTTEEVRNVLLGKPMQATLKRENFDYITSDFDILCDILRSAARTKAQGINILLYGNPGCGKTELSKAVCAATNLTLYATSDEKENKDSRLGTLSQMQTVLKSDDNSVILFDEAEDVFSLNPFSRNSPSKLYINRRLETNPRPVIWITNKVSDMDRAYIRRFSFALQVSDPNARAKVNAWERVFQTHGVAAPSEMISNLSKKYDVPMALIDTAVKNVKLMNNMEVLETTINGLVRAMNGRSASHTGNDVTFEPSLLNVDTDLQRLAIQLRDKNIQRFSMCLYGAPGTGKTAYAKYLGELLGMPVITRRASDIKGSYVGETERNIANAFATASAQNAILVFDEADSFLLDRSTAHHSWEVGCVNEMLTQMESATHPFICTTNLMRQLDSASLRRFTFKVKYDYLTPEQVIHAFKVFFDCDVLRTDIADLTMLSPGDFSVVRHRASVLNVTSVSELADMLRGEQTVKGAPKTKIGF